MSVQGATVQSTLTTKPLLHIRTDPYSGRKYHASTALPENTDLFGPCAPYSYTIYKRFRNEVCTECWRYDRGRTTFLTRRDDEGLEDETVDGAESAPSSRDGRKQKRGVNTNAVGAGLWFCDENCQQSWIAREGIATIELLRRLEGARQKKPKQDAQQVTTSPGAQITQEVVDRAWDAVRERERSPKEVRKWREQLRLDDFEADMARYVLIALLHYYRELEEQHSRSDPPDSCECENTQVENRPTTAEGRDRAGTGAANRSKGYEQGSGSDWRTFASLQRNELALIRACPEILEHQTRIYQLLKGRFGSDAASSSSVDRPSRSPVCAMSSPNGITSAVAPMSDNVSRIVGQEELAVMSGRIASDCKRPDLWEVVTVENVRTILGVDPGNSFGIWEEPMMEESEGLGFALYPMASLFNHHCSPNVNRKRLSGRMMRFWTTKDVGEGDELCISYLRAVPNAGERRKLLLEGWYFSCRCSSCRAEVEQGPG